MVQKCQERALSIQVRLTAATRGGPADGTITRLAPSFQSVQLLTQNLRVDPCADAQALLLREMVVGEDAIPPSPSFRQSPQPAPPSLPWPTTPPLALVSMRMTGGHTDSIRRRHRFLASCLQGFLGGLFHGSPPGPISSHPEGFGPALFQPSRANRPLMPWERAASLSVMDQKPSRRNAFNARLLIVARIRTPFVSR